ncbi:hypothetical protein OPQ81_008357 [Rhizoctonia solani]|nr:hypothetical protein OPQ81_008357 [Rhizoctonia solani]
MADEWRAVDVQIPILALTNEEEGEDLPEDGEIMISTSDDRQASQGLGMSNGVEPTRRTFNFAVDGSGVMYARSNGT